MAKSGLDLVATASRWLLGVVVFAIVGVVAVVWISLHDAKVRGQKAAEESAAWMVGNARERLAAALDDGELSSSEIADAVGAGSVSLVHEWRSPGRVGITARVRESVGYPFAFGWVDRCVVFAAPLAKGAEVTQREVECPPLTPTS